MTGLSSGQICVLYSPTSSLNGAKLPLSKGPPRKVTIEDMSDALAEPAIITPHALPMFREGEIARGTGKRKREKERSDPRKSRRPELPVTGPGKGGRVGASATQHIVQNLVKDTTREEDVRGNPCAVERSTDYHLPPCTPGPCYGVFDRVSMSRSGRAYFSLLCLLLHLFVIRGSHERRYSDMQKPQRKTRCGRQVSGIRGPEWHLFVIVCLVMAMLTRSFLLPSAARRPSPSLLHRSVRPAICSLDEESTEAGVCRGRTGGGRGGKVKRGRGLSGSRGLADCGRRFPGSVSALVYKGLGQNFPLFQSSLEIPWSPLSAIPSPSHSFCHTPLPSSYPLSTYACTLTYPAK